VTAAILDDKVNPTDPVFPKSLTTKEWIEANFPKLNLDEVSGNKDLSIPGSVTAERKFHVIDDQTSEGQGFGIYPDETEDYPLAGFYMDGGTNVVYIAQTGVGEKGDPETNISVREGNLVMYAHSNGGSTSPHYDKSLTTKEWTEDTFAPKAHTHPTSLAVTALETKVNAGVSGTFEDNNGKTITVTDGIITDLG